MLAYQYTPNPDLFIKSSFALSLLWVAKFYSFLAQDFYNSVEVWIVNAYNSDDYKQWSSFTKKFYNAYHCLKDMFDPFGAYPCLNQFMPHTYTFLCED